MATTIYAAQGDTLDLICFQFYGRTQGVVEQVLEHNPGLASLGPILPHGTTVTLPDISTQPQQSTVPLWD